MDDSENKTVGVHVVFHKMVRTPFYKYEEDENKEECKQDEEQAVLLYKRTQDAPVHPGYWALFGGKRKGEESFEECLKREVTDELEAFALDEALKYLQQLCDVHICRKQGRFSIKYFKAKLDTEMDNLRLKRNMEEDKVEGEGLGWFSEEEIHHLTIRPEDREALARFFHSIHYPKGHLNDGD